MNLIDRSKIEKGVINMFKINMAIKSGEKILVLTDIPTLKEWQIEFLYAEKTYCILDAVTKTDRGVVYLDGDAFIVNTLEEVIDDPCDIAVTLRSLEEVEAAKMRGSIHELNAGVMFFKGSREKNVAFITEWIKEMHILNLKRVGLSEQTALSNLIKKYNKDAFRTYFHVSSLLRI